MKLITPNHTSARILLALTIVFFLTAPSQAETNKIGIIDMQRVWDKYWKTRQAQSQVDDQTADFEKRKKGMLEDYQKANRDYKKLIESAQDQAVSSEERDKRKNAAEKKLLEIKEIEQDANLFQRTTDEQLKMQARRMTENILRDIRDLVDAKAKAGGYTLVIDIAAKSAVGTPIVLYTNGQNDMTQEVLSQLNSTAPVGLIKPDDSKDQAEEKKDEKKVEKK
jgi:outer membrane protein